MSKFLRQLARLDEAADYGQRAYAEAEKVQNQLVIGQSLLERARIAAAQHNTSQASALLSELEPLMRKKNCLQGITLSRASPRSRPQWLSLKAISH